MNQTVAERPRRLHRRGRRARPGPEETSVNLPRGLRLFSLMAFIFDSKRNRELDVQHARMRRGDGLGVLHIEIEPTAAVAQPQRSATQRVAFDPEGRLGEHRAAIEPDIALEHARTIAGGQPRHRLRASIRALVYLRSKHPSRDRIAQVLSYFRRHRRRMRHAAAKLQGWPIGSGVVEAACKILV